MYQVELAFVGKLYRVVDVRKQTQEKFSEFHAPHFGGTRQIGNIKKANKVVKFIDTFAILCNKEYKRGQIINPKKALGL